MNQPILSNEHIQGEYIRKQWHNGEWHYSVIDIIAELLEKDHQQASTYWRKLKSRLLAEGNETVTFCHRLKMKAEDGRLRFTDVVNTEQALRLIQSIPSPKVEPMKLWLASVGTERLQEDEDPELAFLRYLETKHDKYRLQGKAESWIVARIEGIVTRKQFVEALKLAVIDAIPMMYSMATEKLYKGLWHRTTAQLRGELNLTKQDNPRDFFGEYALIYTRLAEKLAADKLGQAEIVTLNVGIEIIWTVAKHISIQAKATSEMLGYDLVTQKPLLSDASMTSS
jgi:hypothetical protein